MSVQIGLPQLQLRNTEIISIARNALEHRERIRGDDAKVDIWCKKIQRLPESAVFVLAHEVFCEIDRLDQVIWFNRTEDRDELWAHSDFLAGLGPRLTSQSEDTYSGFITDYSSLCARVISVPRARSFDESLIDLLSCFFSTPAGAPVAPKFLMATGYISGSHYELLCQQVEKNDERERLEREEWARKARENETEIIRVARELDLDPEPAGIGPVQWYARCPGTGHHVMITPGANEFGCGYCKVKGGVTELRAFVARREKDARHA